MRKFFLSLRPRYQFLAIVLSTILGAFTSAITIYWLFGSYDLIEKAGLITAIYAVLGTIYAVLVAFSVSGVWQNYCASESSVTREAASLMDLVHTAKASVGEKAQLIRQIAIEYLTQVIDVEWEAIAKGISKDIMDPKFQTFKLMSHLMQEVQTIETVSARDNVVFSHILTLLTKWLDARRTRIMISKGNTAKALWPLLMAGAVILSAFHGMFIVQNPILWSVLLLFFSTIIGLSFYLIFTLDSPFAGSPVVDIGPFRWALLCLKSQDEKVAV